MVRLNRIYTRTGDDGSTGLVDGSRAAKDSPRLIAIGEVDELNSAIGIAVAALAGAADSHGALLQSVQNDLFDLGADLATPGADFTPSEMVLRIVPEQVARLERAIDALNADLAPLRSFILPGGVPAAAHVHLARAIARRAERAVITAGRSAPVNPAAQTYLNRLSDLLFVLARAINAGGGAG
ncbi:MAG TPA: cob(I)yrinic acid a,c-diamide adenosyltransferase, partial [Sphingobium sp.]|nr:cob(I)yrinic acid a,c-diamide adenosyltransferase [Sphingobium sp.]